MRQIFFLVLLFITTGLFAQAPANYTNINGRYRWIAGMFDSTFHIPKGTTPSLRTGGSTNSGGLFYNTSDSSVYTYTGTQWIKLRGSLNSNDTTNKYVTQVYKKASSDSVFYVKGGNHIFAFIDSTGGSGGGGGGKIYYFNGGVTMGTFGGFTMYELGDTAVIGTPANFTRATTGNIANFITDVGKPGLLQIPAGSWTIDAYLSETGGGANHAQIYAKLEKWDGSTITTIATSPIEEITNGPAIDIYTFNISVPTTTIAVTDRIIIQFYIQNTNGKTVTLYTQNGYVGEVHTTFTTGIGALNGLTAPSQFFNVGTSGTDFNISSVTATHTFNLPTASATNRGALSTTDWTTFNGKVGGSGTSGQVSYFNGTNSITSSPTFAFTPTSQLLVNNSVTASGAIARGINATPSLTAAANNDVLVGLDINPTFNIGAFTGYLQYGLRVRANINQVNQTDYIARFENTNSSFGNGIELIGAGDKAATRLLLRAANNDGTDVFRVRGNGSIAIGTGNNNNNGTVIDNNAIYLGGFQTIAHSGSVGIVFSPFSAANAVTFRQTGNVLIGTTTDAGFRLDVNGTARVQGATTITGNVSVVTNAGTSQVTIGDGSTSPNGTLRIAKSATSNAANIFFRNVSTDVARIWLDNSDNLTLTNGSNLIVGTTGLQVSGSITAASAIARGVNFTNTLVAAANNDVLVGLDVNPTFTNGAFTGVSNFGLRVRDGSSGEAQITTTRTAVILGNNNASATNSVNTIVLALPTTSGGNLSIQSGTTSGIGLTETPNLDFRNGNGQIFARISSVGAAGNIGRLQIGVAQPSTTITGGAWFYAAANRASTQFLLGSDFTDNSRAVITAHWDGASALILKPNASTTTAPTFRVRNNTDAGDNFLVYGATGNVGINVTSDAGFRLDVNGTARVQGDLTVNGGISRQSSGTTVLTMSNSGGANAAQTFLYNNNAGWAGFSFGRLSDFRYIFEMRDGYTNNYGQLFVTTATNSGTTLPTAPNASAQLQIDATTRGFLQPRMTTAQRDAISTPATGLSVYNTTTNTNDYYNGSAWLNVGQVLVPANNTTGFSISGSSLTGSNAQSLVSLSQTWNTTGNPTAFLLNITNTASGATADLMELQVGGVSQFTVGKSGTIQTTAPAGGTAKPWKLGNVAVVSPTSPDRTIEVEIDGVTYYIHAKTTNN